jgi:hypothetical protein
LQSSCKENDKLPREGKFMSGMPLAAGSTELMCAEIATTSGKTTFGSI